MPPSTRRAAVAAIGVGVLLLAAVALAPAARKTQSARRSSKGATSAVQTARPGQPQIRAVTRAELARARSAARRFLAGYLRFTYGEAAASSVRAMTPTLRRRLRGQR